MNYVGVDLGFNGGIAVLDKDKIRLYPMPTYRSNKKTFYNIAKLKEIVDNISEPVQFWIESAMILSRGRLAIASLFECQGILNGLIVGRFGATECIHSVTPKVWKAQMGVTKDKWSSLRKVVELYPDLAGNFTRVTKDDGIAEALLIAHYGKGLRSVSQDSEQHQ